MGPIPKTPLFSKSEHSCRFSVLGTCHITTHLHVLDFWKLWISRSGEDGGAQDGADLSVSAWDFDGGVQYVNMSRATNLGAGYRDPRTAPIAGYRPIPQPAYRARCGIPRTAYRDRCGLVPRLP